MGLRTELHNIQNGREFGPGATKQDRNIAAYFGRSLGLSIHGPVVTEMRKNDPNSNFPGERYKANEYIITVPNGHASVQSVERGVEKMIQRGDLPKGSFAEYQGENKVSLFVPIPKK